MTFPQFHLDLHDELIVDLFAGGGGASDGIREALGRESDIAINHDAAAVALHKLNHPQTHHHTCDVFEVDPRTVTGGRPVGLLWASPDCTYHSKARGAKPIRHANKKRRALAWVVTRWCAQMKPRVVMLENVEEFVHWGPLVAKRDPETGRVLKLVNPGADMDDADESKRPKYVVAEPGEVVPVELQALTPDPRRRAKHFRRWLRSLEELGYVVDYRELKACDFGAPTIRKRLFLVARCDGQPIVWPEPTHGPGRAYPYRTAAECIDWSIPMLSIFATKSEARAWAKKLGQAIPIRPLAEATMRRVARGVMRYVVNAARPFIVPIQNASGRGAQSADEPLRTVTAMPKGGGFAVAAPMLVPRYGERDGQEPRVRSTEQPLATIVATDNGGSLAAAQLATYYGSKSDRDVRGSAMSEPVDTIPTENRHALVASFMARHYGGVVGKDLREPQGTVLSKGAQDQLVAAHLSHMYTSNTAGGQGDPTQPLKTQTTANHAGLIYGFLQKYYGQGIGQDAGAPMDTITTKDRFGIVMVTVDGVLFAIVDICMRMLQPRELYNAQGFSPNYRINCQVWDMTRKKPRWRWLTKTEQVRMVGNSVSPPVATALAAANVPELAMRKVAA